MKKKHGPTTREQYENIEQMTSVEKVLHEQQQWHDNQSQLRRTNYMTIT